ncbi:MAG: thiol reductant ABC exporter subunit CydC [Pseudonocardia sp.]
MSAGELATAQAGSAEPVESTQPMGLRESLRPIWSMLAMLRRHRLVMSAAVLLGIAYQTTLVVAAGLGAWLVAEAAAGAPATELRTGVVVLLALAVPAAVGRLVESYYAHVAGFRTMADIRGRVYAAFERLSPGYLLERRSGDLGAVVIADIEKIELLFAHTLGPVVVASTVPLVAAAGLGVLHWSLLLVFLPVLVLLATVPAWLRRRAEAQGHELRESLGELSAEVIDTVQGLREIVSFGSQTHRLGLLRARGARLRAANIAHGRRTGLEAAATDTIAVAGVLAILLTGASLVSSGSLSTIWFPVAVVVAAVSMVPFIQATRYAQELGPMIAAAARVLRLVEAPTPVTDRVDTPPAGSIEARIRFQDVSFGYSTALADAVTDISFEVAPGETVALVGHSGAGKSTCASLLLRLWDVRRGGISIGGHDIRDFPQDDLRRLLTLVPQDVFLFNVSVAENIRLGRPEATDEQVRAAARTALLEDFITALPDGYDTIAGELGARMSGGQRQRVAIARALLKDAPILVMDEAVSNLDTTSEREVAAAMARARTGRTTLVIAHRLSTIRAADRIVVLESGRVVQTGTHEELIAAGGAYTRLLASQLDPDRNAEGSDEVDTDR